MLLKDVIRPDLVGGFVHDMETLGRELDSFNASKAPVMADLLRKVEDALRASIPQGHLGATMEDRTVTALSDAHGRVRLRGWRKIRPIKGGGQAVVSIVERAGPEPRVGVLKQLPEHRVADRKALRRLIHEIRIIQRLKHPCIVRILGASKGDPPWLISEWAPFGSMDDQREFLRGDAWRTLRLARDVACALGAVHALGIIHRDVKPANLLLRDLDHVIVADFGIAFDPDLTTLTSTAEHPGSRHFSPPERDRRTPPTPAWDVYSLGKVIYYALSGGRLVPREEFDTESTDLRRLLDRAELETVNEILRRMIVYEPGDRWQTMGDVVSGIDRALGRLFGARHTANACLLCREGVYLDCGQLGWTTPTQFSVEDGTGPAIAIHSAYKPRLLMCNRCGHAQVRFENQHKLALRPPWTPGPT